MWLVYIQGQLALSLLGNCCCWPAAAGFLLFLPKRNPLVRGVAQCLPRCWVVRYSRLLSNREKRRALLYTYCTLRGARKEQQNSPSRLAVAKYWLIGHGSDENQKPAHDFVFQVLSSCLSHWQFPFSLIVDWYNLVFQQPRYIVLSCQAVECWD